MAFSVSSCLRLATEYIYIVPSREWTNKWIRSRLEDRMFLKRWENNQKQRERNSTNNNKYEEHDGGDTHGQGTRLEYISEWKRRRKFNENQNETSKKAWIDRCECFGVPKMEFCCACVRIKTVVNLTAASHRSDLTSLMITFFFFFFVVRRETFTVHSLPWLL